MLVVIAIIGVLAMLLMSAIGAAGEKAASAKCMANLRTIGTGALNFVADNDGYLFTDAYYLASWQVAGGYRRGFRDYVGVTSTNTSLASNSGLWVDTSFTCPQVKKIAPDRFPSYVNRCYSVNPYACRDNPATTAVENKKLASITTPSKTWMFMDGLRINAGNTTQLGTYYASLTNMASPHRGCQSVLFFDGSVRPMTAAELGALNNTTTTAGREFWGVN